MPEKLFFSSLNIDEHLDLLKSVVELGLRFKIQDEVRLGQQTRPEHFEVAPAPTDGIGLSGLLSEFERLCAGSTNFASPGFLGFPDAGNSIPAVAASLLIPLLNQNLINQEFCAPAATFVEIETIHWLRELIGFHVPTSYYRAIDIGGCGVHGGVLANTIALLAAREALFPGALQSGLPRHSDRVKVLVPSGIGHYSVRVSLAWLGLGERSIVEIPITSGHRYDTQALETSIRALHDEGFEIMACVAYAGDSRTMAIDDFEVLSRILSQHQIWLHVDACHGVQLLFSSNHRSKLNGLAMADSVAMDPHKVLWIPYACSYVLFKDQKGLRAIASSSDLITKEKWSLGQSTPFIGSKAFNSLKLWSLIKTLGTNQIGKLVDDRLALHSQIREMVRGERCLLLLNETDINSVMFMYLPDQYRDGEIGFERLHILNEINLQIRNAVNESGQWYVHTFPIPSSSYVDVFPREATLQVLRVMSGNPLASQEHIRHLIKDIVGLGDSIAQRMLGVEPSKDIRQTALMAELTEWLRGFLGGVSHMSLVYGSSVSQREFFASDIDLMIIADDRFCTPENRRIAIQHIVDLHRRFNLPLDDEIPFSRKLLVELTVAERAIRGAGYELERHAVRVPRIEKTSEFLGSEAMLARLVVNVLTTNSVLLSGSFEIYHRLKRRAIRLIVWLIFKQVDDVGNIDEVAELLYGSDGMSGEAFLGYKKSQEFDRYFRPTIAAMCSQMLSKGELIEFEHRILLGQQFDFEMLRMIQRASQD